jgi:hypothetical protein
MLTAQKLFQPWAYKLHMVSAQLLPPLFFNINEPYYGKDIHVSPVCLLHWYSGIFSYDGLHGL